MAKAKTPRTPTPRSKKEILPPAVDPGNKLENAPAAVTPQPKIAAAKTAVPKDKLDRPTNGQRPAELESEIRARAYQLYLERGSTPGHQHEDWTRAEQEVLTRHNQQSA